MAYVPDATQVTQPTSDKTVLSAAEEFRKVKVLLNDAVADLLALTADFEAFRDGVEAGTDSTALAANLLDSSSATKGDYLLIVKRIIVGAVAARLHDWIEARPLNTKSDFAIIADSVTDQTTALTTVLTALGGASYRGVLQIPEGTVFNPITVFAAVPAGVTLDISDTTNWGQPPGYKNKFFIRYSGDLVADDTQTIFSSPHHPALMFLNMGTAAGASAAKRLCSILFAVGQDYSDDPLLAWLVQSGKDDTSDKWMLSYRIQTPYSVAIKNPQNWVTATVYAAGAHCVSDGGKIYKTTAGGTSGVTAPTGTGTGINDGGVLWDYVQAALSIDSTRYQFDEDGDMRLYGSGNQRTEMHSGSASHYFDVNAASGDIVWTDQGRGRQIAKVSTANGVQLGGTVSYNFAGLTGATPALTTDSVYLTQAGATTVTNFTLPTGITAATIKVLFGDALTTINHGGNFILKGGVNLAPVPSGAVMEFIKYPPHSAAWVEASRNF